MLQHSQRRFRLRVGDEIHVAEDNAAIGDGGENHIGDGDLSTVPFDGDIDGLHAFAHDFVEQIVEGIHASAVHRRDLIHGLQILHAGAVFIKGMDGGGRKCLRCGHQDAHHQNTRHQIDGSTGGGDDKPLPHGLFIESVGIIGLLILPGHADKAAEGEQAERIGDARLFRCMRKDFRSHADGKFVHGHMEQAGKEVVSRFVNQNENSENKNREKNV